MPWGSLSAIRMKRQESNDGPILWCRPGEQLVPTLDSTKSPFKRKRYETRHNYLQPNLLNSVFFFTFAEQELTN